MQGMVKFDPANLESSRFEVCIDPGSFKSDRGLRDSYVTGRNFLGVKNYPKICFESQQFSKSPEGYMVTGQLSIREVSRQVSIPFEYNDGVLTGSLELNRFDYDLSKVSEKRMGAEFQAMIHCVLK
jgi:polyisoprenoid-binding protein YceI